MDLDRGRCAEILDEVRRVRDSYSDVVPARRLVTTSASTYIRLLDDGPLF